MVDDFCKRSKCRYIPEQIEQCLKENYSLVTEDSFFIFNIVQDEMHIMFGYVKPGTDISVYKDALEMYAKNNGCKYLKFLTRRAKAFARRFKDYQPCAVMFEKKVN